MSDDRIPELSEQVPVIVVCTGWRKARTQDAPMVALAFSDVERHHGPIHLVMEGGAGGIDHLCRLEARRREVPCLTVPAEWSKHGNAAGPRRNARMAALASQLGDRFRLAVVGLAFPHETSKGTLDMIARIEALHWPLHVYRDFTKEQVSA